MSTTREKLDAWHAYLDQWQAERMAAKAKERQQRQAKPVKTEEAPSTFDADHETASGIRSVWN